MKSIFKYPLQIARLQIIEMPEGAKLLSVQMQNGIPTLWAFVNTDFGPTPRKIVMFGTGWEITEAYLVHIGTIQDGSLVWHYFELL